jgi:hypothetical protein
MTLPRIQVHTGRRFLETENGDPFFWLGDTAWELFHRLNRADTDHYLETRRQQGYNVIQAVALAELGGVRVPNANGHVPLLGDDPSRLNEPYFRHMDEVIRSAGEKGLYIALLPTWGDKVVGTMWGEGPVIFTVENARVYGRLLGQRYRADTNLIWVLGGDRPAQGYEALWAAMAEGIIDGLGYRPVFTYHPNGGSSSSAVLHEASWLDVNMFQSGHVYLDHPNWDMTTADYDRTPVKPVLDGEPNYEHHPVDPFLRRWKPEYGRYTDYDVRKQAYRSVFAGACGHTYGSHSIWQFWSPAHPPINFPMPAWDEALYGPGAAHLIWLKRLMLSRPYFSRIPDQAMLPDVSPTSPLGQPDQDRVNPLRAAHARATRCADGTYGMIYFPLADQGVRVDLSPISGPIRAWWFDPRTGKSYSAGDHPGGIVTFTSPLGGPDWVLVLDSAAQNFAAPGMV